MEFGPCFSGEDFMFQLPAHSKVAPGCRSDSVLDFKAEIVVAVNTGSKMYEVIDEFKIMTVKSNLGLESRILRLIR